MAASEYRLSSPSKHLIFNRMMNNPTFVIFVICILNIIFLKHGSGNPFEVKKEQWGVNQERLKVVQREENESSNESESPETATVVKTFSGEALQQPQPCNCGQCVTCSQSKLKSFLLKYKSNGEKRRFYDTSNLFNTNPYESVFVGPTQFQAGLTQPGNPFLNYGYEQQPYLGYDFNPYLGYENDQYNHGYEVDPNLFYPPIRQSPGGYSSYNPYFGY